MKTNFGIMVESLDAIAASGLKSRITDSVGKILDRYESDLLSDDPKVRQNAEKMIIALGGAVL
jgi:hypothetical protein